MHQVYFIAAPSFEGEMEASALPKTYIFYSPVPGDFFFQDKLQVFYFSSEVPCYVVINIVRI